MGVLVLPTEGFNIYGEYYRNYGNKAEWEVLPYKIDEKGMKVFYNNEWLKVLATIHTHPNVLESTGLLMHSSSDMTTHQKLKTFSIVLAKDRNAVYGYYPQGDAVGTITTLDSLLSGKFSIIRNYRYIISEIKKQIKK